MSSTRDFVAATFADALLPMMRRPVEDVIYETIDRRQMPTRTDFTEIRDLVNSLRGQLTGATGGVKRLAETTEEFDERLADLEEKLQKIEAVLIDGSGTGALQARLAAAEATVVDLTARLAKAEALEQKVDALAARLATRGTEPTGTAPVRKTVQACRVPGCTSPVRARGLCARHYQQLRRGTLTEADLS